MKMKLKMCNTIGTIDNTKYRYKFYHGNNGRIVLQAYRKRTWMHPAASNKLKEKSSGEVDNSINSPRGISTSDSTSTSTRGNRVNTPVDVDVDISGTNKTKSVPVDFELLWEMYRSPKRYKGNRYKDCVLNHIQGNNVLVTKKGKYA